MCRSKALCVLFFWVLSLSREAAAFGWQDLWERPEQQVQKLVDEGSFEEAEALVHSDEQRALLKYRSGDFEAAAKLYQQQADNYNYGSSLLRAEDYAGAVAAYDQLLEAEPDNKDAMHNREIAQKLAELQPQQEQQQGDGEQEGEREEQDSDSEGKPSGSDGQPEEPADTDSKENPEEGKGNEPDAAAEQDEPEDAPTDEPQEQGEPKEGEAEEDKPHDEEQQALEQQLQRVPDDPAGLLRARIMREHQRSHSGSQDQEQAW